MSFVSLHLLNLCTTLTPATAIARINAQHPLRVFGEPALGGVRKVDITAPSVTSVLSALAAVHQHTEPNFTRTSTYNDDELELLVAHRALRAEDLREELGRVAQERVVLVEARACAGSAPAAPGMEACAEGRVVSAVAVAFGGRGAFYLGHEAEGWICGGGGRVCLETGYEGDEGWRETHLQVSIELVWSCSRGRLGSLDILLPLRVDFLEDRRRLGCPVGRHDGGGGSSSRRCTQREALGLVAAAQLRLPLMHTVMRCKESDKELFSHMH